MGIQQKPRWELAIAMSLSDINGSCWTSRDYQLSHNVWHQMPMEPQINNDVIFFYSHCWQKDCFVWVVYQCDFEVRSKVLSLILCLRQMACVGLESCMSTSVNPVCQSFVGLCSPVCGPCVLVCTWLLTGVCFPSSLCPTESHNLPRPCSPGTQSLDVTMLFSDGEEAGCWLADIFILSVTSNCVRFHYTHLTSHATCLWKSFRYQWRFRKWTLLFLWRNSGTRKKIQT